MGSGSTLSGPAVVGRTRESRVGAMLKDHKETLAAILRAAKGQAGNDPTHPGKPCVSEAKLEIITKDNRISSGVECSGYDSVVCKVEELRVQAEGPEVRAEKGVGGQSTAFEESQHAQGLEESHVNGILQQEASTGRVLNERRGFRTGPLAGNLSLSSSGTFTPGQLSGGSFPSPFPSPMPIDQDPPIPVTGLRGPLAPASMDQLPPPPTQTFQGYPAGFHAGVTGPLSNALLTQGAAFSSPAYSYPLAPTAQFPQPASVNGTTANWPWLSGGSDAASSPYEIALMYLQGGPFAPPPPASTPHNLHAETGSQMLAAHQHALMSSSLRTSLESGLLRSAGSGLPTSAEGQLRSSRSGGGMGTRHSKEEDELETGSFVPQAAGRFQNRGHMQTDSFGSELQSRQSVRRQEEFEDERAGGLLENMPVRALTTSVAQTSRGRPTEAAEWGEYEREMQLGGAGRTLYGFGTQRVPWKENVGAHALSDEEREHADVVYDADVADTAHVANSADMANSADVANIADVANGGDCAGGSRVAANGRSFVSRELGGLGNRTPVVSSLDERPLPSYPERRSPAKPRSEAITVQMGGSNNSASCPPEKHEKRPFLKRGSRLLKSVIPRKGDKESWVAEFRGKIAAVPRAVEDPPPRDEQMDGADWGVLNAQKASSIRKVQPVTTGKRGVVKRGNLKVGVKAEAPKKAGGDFLRAGGRGGRPHTAQNNRLSKPAPTPPGKPSEAPTLQPPKSEVQPLDDLELAEFQALERRLKGHVLDDPESDATQHAYANAPAAYANTSAAYMDDPNAYADAESQHGHEGESFADDMQEAESQQLGWEENVAGRRYPVDVNELEKLAGGGSRGAVNWGAEEAGKASPLNESAEWFGNPGRDQEVELGLNMSERDGSKNRSRFRDSQQWGDERKLPSRGVTPSPLADPPQQRPERPQIGVPGRPAPGRGAAAVGVPGDSPRVSALVKTMFQAEGKKQGAKTGGKQNSGPDMAAEMAFLKEKMATLDSEIQRFKRENEKTERARLEFEARSDVVAKERATWEKRMQEEEVAWNRKKEAEAQKLKRDKRVLEQQSRALLQLPGRKARSEADELRAQIAALEEDKRVREARWRLTVDRLKGRVEELTDRNKELEGEVKRHEARWLERLDEQENSGAANATSAKPARSASRPQTAVSRKGPGSQPEGAETLPRRANSSREGSVLVTRSESKSPEKSGARQRGSGVRFATGGIVKNGGVNGLDERGGKGAGVSEHSQDRSNGSGLTWSFGVNGLTNRESRVNGLASRNSGGVNGLANQENGGLKGFSNQGLGVNGLTNREMDGDGDARPEVVDEHDVDTLLRKGRELRNAAFGSSDVPGFGRGYSLGVDGFGSNQAAGVAGDHDASGELEWEDCEKSTALSSLVETGYETKSGGVLGRLPPGRSENPDLTSVRNLEDNRRVKGGRDENGSGGGAIDGTEASGERDTDWGLGGSVDRASEGGSRAGLREGLVDNLEEEEGDGELLEEIVGPAGKVERVYGSGRRVIVFGNGTKKEVHPNGKVCIFFTNGDVKNSHADGRVEYYYAEVETWHTTYADGVEVFHFPNGQVEQHEPDGSKEIFFSDGAVRRVNPDGTEEEVGPLD